ncbi:glycosyltransferase [Alteromonadaceae bacterium BrNp21-10]|nr:glycosyltransferase [Alteromonadaceae bacterium BrNp21-10]
MDRKPIMLAFSQALSLSLLHPYFFKGMVEPFYTALSEQFQLIIVDHYDDVAESINNVSPDIIMIDPGPAVMRSELPNPEVLQQCMLPKVIYTTLDAHYHSHQEIIEFAEKIVPDAIFSHDFYHDFYPAKWHKKLFYIPNSYNHMLFRNRNLPKDIVCGFYGAGFFDGQNYPWRKRIAARVVPEFPSYILPRPTGLRDHGIVGENFVKVMNRTQFIFGCTSVKDIPVKKLFEIPACGGLLMVNDSVVLGQLGFKDGVNCCVVDSHNVLQRIRFYLDAPDEYNKVVHAGQMLVEEFHQSAHRRHILNWFKAWKRKERIGRVEQSSWLGEFQVRMPDESSIGGLFAETDIGKTLKAARNNWAVGSYVEAGKFYADISQHCPLLAESSIGYVASLIYQGKFETAAAFIEKYARLMRHRNSSVINLQLLTYALLLKLFGYTSSEADEFFANHALWDFNVNVDLNSVIQRLGISVDESCFSYTNTELAESTFTEHIQILVDQAKSHLSQDT